MFCPNCGTNNEPGAMHCVQCGARLAAPVAPLQPMMPAPVVSIPNYMTQSILVTLCCCLPMGIVCILKANKVDRLLAVRDYEGAMQASRENKTLLWVGAALGLVGGVLWAIVQAANK